MLNLISPAYENIRKELESHITGLDGEYEKLTAILSKHGEEWHKEIDGVINQINTELNKIKANHRDILIKHLKEIEQIEALLKENMSTLKDLERVSNVVSTIMEYTSRNSEFRKPPSKVDVSFPTFCPKPMDREKVYTLIGSIKTLTFTKNENGYILEKQRNASKELLDTPEVINTFNTGYKNPRSVFFYSKQEIWASVESNEIKCFAMRGYVTKAIINKSGEWPEDIAVTSDGCLLYSDWKLQTFNKVVNGQIEEIITLHGWIPGNMCVTSSGDILVVMCDETRTQFKVVRYSGSVEKHAIMYKEDSTLLYPVKYSTKYIAENRNLDICVAVYAVGAVVVVDQSGKLRFRYIGHSSRSKQIRFNPRGITTNSQSQILTADGANHCIHILDHEGEFLGYVFQYFSSS